MRAPSPTEARRRKQRVVSVYDLQRGREDDEQQGTPQVPHARASAGAPQASAEAEKKEGRGEGEATPTGAAREDSEPTGNPVGAKRTRSYRKEGQTEASLGRGLASSANDDEGSADEGEAGKGAQEPPAAERSTAGRMQLRSKRRKSYVALALGEADEDNGDSLPATPAVKRDKSGSQGDDKSGGEGLARGTPRRGRTPSGPSPTGRRLPAPAKGEEARAPEVEREAERPQDAVPTQDELLRWCETLTGVVPQPLDWELSPHLLRGASGSSADISANLFRGLSGASSDLSLLRGLSGGEGAMSAGLHPAAAAVPVDAGRGRARAPARGAAGGKGAAGEAQAASATGGAEAAAGVTGAAGRALPPEAAAAADADTGVHALTRAPVHSEPGVPAAGVAAQGGPQIKEAADGGGTRGRKRKFGEEEEDDNATGAEAQAALQQRGSLSGHGDVETTANREHRHGSGAPGVTASTTVATVGAGAGAALAPTAGAAACGASATGSAAAVAAASAGAGCGAAAGPAGASAAAAAGGPPSEAACLQQLTAFASEQRRRPQDNSISFWWQFVRRFFHPAARMRWCVASYGAGGRGPAAAVSPQERPSCELCQQAPGRGFEATPDVLPRLFQALYASGVKEELLLLDAVHSKPLAGNCRVLLCPAARMHSVMPRVTVLRRGCLRVVMGADCRLMLWEFCLQQHEELVSRPAVLQQVGELAKGLFRFNHQLAGSRSLQEAQWHLASLAGHLGSLAGSLDQPQVNDLGFTKAFVRCLQISEVVHGMRDLMELSLRSGMGPKDALRLFPSIKRTEPQAKTVPEGRPEDGAGGGGHTAAPPADAVAPGEGGPVETNIAAAQAEADEPAGLPDGRVAGGQQPQCGKPPEGQLALGGAGGEEQQAAVGEAQVSPGEEERPGTGEQSAVGEGGMHKAVLEGVGEEGQAGGATEMQVEEQQQGEEERGKEKEEGREGEMQMDTGEDEGKGKQGKGLDVGEGKEAEGEEEPWLSQHLEEAAAGLCKPQGDEEMLEQRNDCEKQEEEQQEAAAEREEGRGGQGKQNRQQQGVEQQQGEEEQKGEKQKGEEHQQGEEQQQGEQQQQQGEEELRGEEQQQGKEEQKGEVQQQGEEEQKGEKEQKGEVQQQGEEEQKGEEEQPLAEKQQKSQHGSRVQQKEQGGTEKEDGQRDEQQGQQVGEVQQEREQERAHEEHHLGEKEEKENVVERRIVQPQSKEAQETRRNEGREEPTQGSRLEQPQQEQRIGEEVQALREGEENDGSEIKKGGLHRDEGRKISRAAEGLDGQRQVEEAGEEHQREREQGQDEVLQPRSEPTGKQVEQKDGNEGEEQRLREQSAEGLQGGRQPLQQDSQRPPQQPDQQSAQQPPQPPDQQEGEEEAVQMGQRHGDEAEERQPQDQPGKQLESEDQKEGGRERGPQGEPGEQTGPQEEQRLQQAKEEGEAELQEQAGQEGGRAQAEEVLLAEDCGEQGKEAQRNKSPPNKGSEEQEEGEGKAVEESEVRKEQLTGEAMEVEAGMTQMPEEQPNEMNEGEEAKGFADDRARKKDGKRMGIMGVSEMKSQLDSQSTLREQQKEREVMTEPDDIHDKAISGDGDEMEQ